MMNLPIVLTSVSLCASPCLSQQLTSGSWITQWFSCSENNWFITGWINTAFWMGTVVGRFQQIISSTQTSQRDLCAHFNQHCAHLFAFSFSAEQTLVSSELCSCCKRAIRQQCQSQQCCCTQGCVWSWWGEKFNTKMSYMQLAVYGEAHKGSSWWWHWAVKQLFWRKLEGEIKKRHTCTVQLTEVVRASWSISY